MTTERDTPDPPGGSGGHPPHPPADHHATDDLADLYRSHRGSLTRLAAVVLGDAGAAADVVQEAFADLARVRTDVDDPGAWLRRVVVNRSTSLVRRRIVARAYLARYGRAEVDAAGAGPGGDLSDRLAVRDAMARLSADQRAAVFLRYYLDLAEREVADALGCRPGTVKSRLSRALTHLRADLSDGGTL